MTRLARRDRAQQPACAEGGEPYVSNPRCSLRVWPTCGWHSATGEQLASRQAHRTDRQQRSSGAAGSPAERHITLATPAVLQADRGTESHQPPCAGRDGRGGSCDAPVASHREAARPSAKGVEPAAPSSGALLRRSATARAAKRRQLHPPNLGSEGRPTPRWQPLHASYAAGAADARSRAPRTLFLAATAARCVLPLTSKANVRNAPLFAPRRTARCQQMRCCRRQAPASIVSLNRCASPLVRDGS